MHGLDMLSQSSVLTGAQASDETDSENNGLGSLLSEAVVTRVECPYSTHFWYEIEGRDDPVVHVMMCRGCKRMVRYYVKDGKVIALGVVTAR